MRDRKVIDEMVSLAERFGQTIEFDEFDGRGGWCRVKGTDRVIVNQRLTPREQIRILAQVLAGYPIDEQAMAPKVRQIIEDAKAEQQPEPEPVPFREPEPEPPLPVKPGPAPGPTPGQMPASMPVEEDIGGEASEQDSERADRDQGGEHASG